MGLGLTGTLAASGLLAGCTLDPPSAEPAAGAPEDPEPDADVLLLGTVLAALDDTVALVTATLARHPRLAGDLQPLVDVHAAHRAVLDEAADVEQDTTDVPTVPGRQELALDRVRRAETRLAGALRAATGTAQSGDFARALASMAASVTQHLSVLDSRRAAA
ncbi:hypothetical protein ASG94_02640 [Nocardioides sp. Soil805]|nr:hypothetical protein ASG94_02640 [Nocardioides sp. Soil805]